MKRQILWWEMREALYETLGIIRTTNLSQYGQCPKKATDEYYE